MSAREEIERILAEIAAPVGTDREPTWNVDHWPLGRTRYITGSFWYLVERTPQPVVARLTLQGVRNEDIANRALLAALGVITGRTA